MRLGLGPSWWVWAVCVLPAGPREDLSAPLVPRLPLGELVKLFLEGGFRARFRRSACTLEVPRLLFSLFFVSFSCFPLPSPVPSCPVPSCPVLSCPVLRGVLLPRAAQAAWLVAFLLKAVPSTLAL